MAKTNMLTEAELVAELAKVETRMGIIRKKMEPLEHSWKLAVGRKETLKNALADLHQNDLGYIIRDIHAYAQWVKMLPKQSFENGYWGDTMEQSFKIKLNYQETPSQELIDFIQEYAMVSKRPRMGVFRYDLSEVGTWNVELVGDEWTIYDTQSYMFRYQNEVEFKTKDLAEMLRYIAGRHYYQGGPVESSDD